jgi:hypothetical protein
MSNIKLSGPAGIELMSSPRTSGNEIVAEDSSVSVAYYKVWSDSGLVVVMFVVNTSSAPLQNVTVGLEINALLRSDIKIEGEGSLAAPNRIVFTRIQPRSNAAVIIKLSVAGFGPSSLNVKSVVSYTSVLNAQIPVDTADFLRPAAMDTSGFGSRWGSHSLQRVIVIKPTSVATPHDFMDRMEKRLRIHPVEIKALTNEAIAVGRLAGTDQLCLVHGKVRGPGELALTIRSMNQGYSDWVAAKCQQLLA